MPPAAMRPLRTRWLPRPGGCAFALVLATLANSPKVVAHHSPGHGAPESIRTLNTAAGRSPQAMQRALLLGEYVKSTAEPNLNAATVYTVSALLSLRLHPWFSVGVQAPFVVVDEVAANVPTQVGYGDTRLELRFTPHADVPSPEVLTFGLNLSVPTRTVRFQVDPGPLWDVAPLFAYTRAYGAWSWQAVLLTPVDHRPAGTAFETSGVLVLNYRPFAPFTLSAGALADVRLKTLCALAGGGTGWCSEGRVTERNRQDGATRGYATVGSSLDVTDDFTLSASVQVPFTARRDFDLAASVGLEARF